MAQRVAIRTDGKFAHRKDTIEGVAQFYDCSQTRALLAAAEDAPRFARSVKRVLSRDDLTDKQRQEIAEELSTASLKFNIDVQISAVANP